MDPNQGMHPLIIPDATNQMGNALRSERSFTAGAFGSESKSGFLGETEIGLREDKR